MSAQQSDASVGANASTVTGLRELADFIESHPELPPIKAFAYVDEYRWPTRDARADLTTVARALGDRAVEIVHSSSLRVEVIGEFTGGVKFTADAKISDLRDEPEPRLSYEPIIGERS